MEHELESTEISLKEAQDLLKEIELEYNAVHSEDLSNRLLELENKIVSHYGSYQLIRIDIVPTKHIDFYQGCDTLKLMVRWFKNNIRHKKFFKELVISDAWKIELGRNNKFHLHWIMFLKNEGKLADNGKEVLEYLNNVVLKNDYGSANEYNLYLKLHSVVPSKEDYEKRNKARLWTLYITKVNEYSTYARKVSKPNNRLYGLSRFK